MESLDTSEVKPKWMDGKYFPYGDYSYKFILFEMTEEIKFNVETNIPFSEYNCFEMTYSKEQYEKMKVKGIMKDLHSHSQEHISMFIKFRDNINLEIHGVRSMLNTD